MPVHAGATMELQVVFWLLTVGIIALIGCVKYLWHQNDAIKTEKQDAMVLAIKDSIDNLSQTITGATKDFKTTVGEIWGHIGNLQEEVSWLTGQHEINHKEPYKGVERRQHPRTCTYKVKD